MKKFKTQINRPLSSLKLQEGTSLIEVMIAGFLFVVGLLGLLATQGLAIKMSNSSSMHTSATILVSELYDRVKANPVAMEAGHYTTANFKAADWGGVRDCSNVELTCTPLQQAMFDQARWKASLESQFPSNVTATIVRTAAANSQFQVNIIWQDAIQTDVNQDFQEDNKSSNCANGADRPANEKAVCALMDFGTMGVF